MNKELQATRMKVVSWLALLLPISVAIGCTSKSTVPSQVTVTPRADSLSESKGFPTIHPAAVSDTSAKVRVLVSGEVYLPGVVSVPDGSKVAEALAAAGDITRLAQKHSFQLVRTNTEGKEIIYRARDLGLNYWLKIPVANGDRIEIPSPQGE